MQKRKRNRNRWISIFFSISLSHDNLANHYQTNFAMMQHYHYNLSDLHEMLPWERQIYVEMLMQHIETENEKLKKGK